MEKVVEGINKWKFNTFDKVRRLKKELMKRLEWVQSKLQLHHSFGGMRCLEVKLKMELSLILNQEEVMWFQWSRTMWLADEDHNTKFYHIQTIARRKRNMIVILKNNMGDWITDHDTLRTHVTDFYKNLFESPNGWSRWDQTGITFPKLKRDVMDQLNADICMDEVKCALFSMKPWKAPGLDGFPAYFYQKSWEIVGGGISDFVKDAWHNPSIIDDINKIDTCLIQKVDHPQKITEFPPISLCIYAYKFITKVIVERFKPHISYLVSHLQTGFVLGRAIHKNIIIANEVIHSMSSKKGRKGFFAVKIDLFKALIKLIGSLFGEF